MNQATQKSASRALYDVGRFFWNMLLPAAAFFLVELFGYLLLKPADATCLGFGALWALMLSALIQLLPRKAGRIVFGILYYLCFGWTLAQCGYYAVFGKLMWLSTISFAGEGGAFLGDVIGSFPLLWWLGGAIMLLLGALVIWKYPKGFSTGLPRLPYLAFAGAFILCLCALPEAVFQRDNGVWGTRSEFGQSSSLRARYTTMYDAKSVYDICGMYQLTLRDIWKYEIYPLTPAYQKAQEEETTEIDAYFAQRGDHQVNEMTGVLSGKNVILVLMESMDDWMITETDTPTLSRLMDESINFTNFYTPGYGSARTLNSEFCVNTGIYLPTTGSYVFNYVTNQFNQSIASQMTANGYTAEVFHYNNPNFYSRGVFEPAMGYNSYVYYGDYVTDQDLLYDDCLLFDVQEINDLFFREGQTFNTIITRSAHLSYKYNEVLSHYALKQYPEYRGMYASEEEDCARVKAKLVDDMFARLLEELEAKGQLENTVIIGVTDHYTYGYKNIQELLAHSGVDAELLLEKTPCFIWSADGPALEVTKTLNTADLLPTVLNLLGIDSPYHYLGQDAFDPAYVGYALFPDGSWTSQGVFCKALSGSKVEVLMNSTGADLTEDYLAQMADTVQNYIRISNLLLTSDYYKEIR